jgi:hypothetical protein
VGVLAVALRGAWRPYAAALVEPMILTGLSLTLVQALQARAAARSQAAVFAEACFGSGSFPKYTKGVLALPPVLAEAPRVNSCKGGDHAPIGLILVYS